MPELAAPGGTHVPEPDPSQARFRLFDAVTAVLRSAARTRPLLLVLDDLHTADPSSLALLHFLARNLRGTRALVIGTYRDEEARLVPELGQLLGDIAREGTYLPLAPLTRAEISELWRPSRGDQQTWACSIQFRGPLKGTHCSSMSCFDCAAAGGRTRRGGRAPGDWRAASARHRPGGDPPARLAAAREYARPARGRFGDRA